VFRLTTLPGLVILPAGEPIEADRANAYRGGSRAGQTEHAAAGNAGRILLVFLDAVIAGDGGAVVPGVVDRQEAIRIVARAERAGYIDPDERGAGAGIGAQTARIGGDPRLEFGLFGGIERRVIDPGGPQGRLVVDLVTRFAPRHKSLHPIFGL
jgi:hypothetical protein